MEAIRGLVAIVVLTIAVFVLHELTHAVVAHLYGIPLRRVRIGVPTLVRMRVRGTEVHIGLFWFLISVAYDGNTIRRRGRVPGAILALSAPVVGAVLPLLGLWAVLRFSFKLSPLEEMPFLELMARPEWWVVYLVGFSVVVNLLQLIPIPTSDFGRAVIALLVPHTRRTQEIVYVVCQWTNRILFVVAAVLLVFAVVHMHF